MSVPKGEGGKMKVKCFWFIGHKWFKWSDVVWGKEKKVIIQNVIPDTGTSIYQTRTCEVCGYSQIRRSNSR